MLQGLAQQLEAAEAAVGGEGGQVSLVDEAALLLLKAQLPLEQLLM